MTFNIYPSLDLQHLHCNEEGHLQRGNIYNMEDHLQRGYICIKEGHLVRDGPPSASKDDLHYMQRGTPYGSSANDVLRLLAVHPTFNRPVIPRTMVEIAKHTVSTVKEMDT
ncbi:hypothetical protein CLAIMM_14220 [Cladophialophora immunda]|nr:hypothetical protein CLAIMM_14220 [Cladophialophora immunda]